MTEEKYSDGYEDEEEPEFSFKLHMDCAFNIDSFVQSTICPDYIGIVTGLLLEHSGVTYQVAWGPGQEGQMCTAAELMPYMDNVESSPN